MGKNRKPFIDKKTASTYHLLHRSQRDVGGFLEDEGTDDDHAVSGSAMILWPSPQNRPELDQQVLAPKEPTEPKQLTTTSSLSSVAKTSRIEDWKRPLQEVGLIDDYDYEQHLKPITGTGTFLGFQGVVSPGLFEARSRPLEDPTIHEVSRQLESIALTADCMDDDVAQVLFDDYEDGDFEELNDDFVLMAAQEPETNNTNGGDDNHHEEFDFDAHIRRLMERAKSSDPNQDNILRGHDEHDWAKQAHDFFSKATPLHKIDDDDDDEYDEDDTDQLWESNMVIERVTGTAPTLSSEEQRAFCEQFEQTLAEYDDDDEDDDDDVESSWPDQQSRGLRPLQHDAQVESALDDFLQERRDEIFFHGKIGARKNTSGGSGFSALVGSKLVHAQDLPEALQIANTNGIEPIDVTLNEAKDSLEQPTLPPPAEEIFIDGKSYFSERERSPWDCESILSTYSNLDNNPFTIGTTRNRTKKKKQTATMDSNSIPQVLLSSKTGLPISVFQSSQMRTSQHLDNGDETHVSVNRGEARRKEESAQEKKSRKGIIKSDRRAARLQKKSMKEAFQNEMRKREEGIVSDCVNGQAVFRYT